MNDRERETQAAATENGDYANKRFSTAVPWLTTTALTGLMLIPSDTGSLPLLRRAAYAGIAFCTAYTIAVGAIHLTRHLRLQDTPAVQR